VLALAPTRRGWAVWEDATVADLPAEQTGPHAPAGVDLAAVHRALTAWPDVEDRTPDTDLALGTALLYRLRVAGGDGVQYVFNAFGATITVERDETETAAVHVVGHGSAPLRITTYGEQVVHTSGT
jgi:hypothetical protein